MPISRLFLRLGFPLRNVRWSWGAQIGEAVLLRTWSDELAGRTLRVLDMADANQIARSRGLDERIDHLKALWQDGLAGYTIIATARDPAANPRQIISYRNDAVFPLTRLEQNSNGDIIALIGDPVCIDDLALHARTHRTEPAEGSFPR
jgi:hypothetical protein